MNRKGSVVFLVVLIIVIVLVIGGIWYYETHETAVQPTSQNATSTQNVGVARGTQILSESQAATDALQEITDAPDNFTGLPMTCLTSTFYSNGPATDTVIFKIQTLQNANCNNKVGFPYTYFAKVNLTNGEVYGQIFSTKYINDWIPINPPLLATSTWTTFNDPSVQFMVRYPPDWQFTMNSTTYQSTIWLTSPVTYDLPGYETRGSRYMLGLDVTNDQVTLDPSTSFVEVSPGYVAGQIYQSIPDYNSNRPSSSVYATYAASNVYDIGNAIEGSAEFYGYTSSTIVTISNLDQSGWQQYVNSSSGFSIYLPNYLTVDKTDSANVTFRTQSEEAAYNQLVDACADTGHPGVCASENNDFDMVFGYSSSDSDLLGWSKKAQVIINGISWKKFYDTDDYLIPVYEYTISNGGNDYTFYAPDQQLLQQILSTFKLTQS